MTSMNRRGVAKVLARIKTYHSPQDVGESVITSWSDAFKLANVTNAEDAETAVIQHYSSPGCNRWITPGDVIEIYKAIRIARIEQATADSDVDLHAVLTEDVDPSDAQAYLATLRHRLRALGDGLPLQRVVALPLPAEAAHAAITPADRERRLRAITGGSR